MNYYKKSVTDADVSGKRVFVRCDLNTPQDENGKVTDATRIIAAIPTIRYLTEKNAKVIICTHLGRPKGKVVPEMSVAPIAIETEKHLGLPIKVATDVVGESAMSLLASLTDGDIMMLENIRFDPREEKNDPELSEILASMADIFVNEAFGAAHRAHCSTAGIAGFIPAYAGFLMQRELDILGGALTTPARPFTAILGGSKVSDKISVIENLLNVCDNLIIGGAMAYTFAKAKGGEIGGSRCEMDKIDTAISIMQKAEEKGVTLCLPCDHVCASSFAANADYIIVGRDHIPEGRMALDIGPRSISQFVNIIKDAKTIVWNGPMGVFEFDSFAKGTTKIARAVAESGAMSIVGGGDSVAAVQKSGLAHRITHISTGGGASLELLEGAELPGVACLLDK